jgi:hypothetical protein
MANARLVKVVSVKLAARLRSGVRTFKQAVLSVHQAGGRPSTGIPEILGTEASIAQI